MKQWIVTFEGRVREMYWVTAETADEARNCYWEFEPGVSEVFDGEVIDVEEVDDDE